MRKKLTAHQLACRKALAEPCRGSDPVLHILQVESAGMVKEHEEAEARDRWLYHSRECPTCKGRGRINDET